MIIESCKKMFGEPKNYYEAATVVDADYVIFSEQLPNESLLTELFEDIPERDDIEISMKDEGVCILSRRIMQLGWTNIQNFVTAERTVRR